MNEMEKSDLSQSETEMSVTPQPDSSTPGMMDYSALRRQYGESYGMSGYGLVNQNPELMVKIPLDMMGWENEFRKKDLDPRKTLDEWTASLKANFADYNTFRAMFGKYDAQWAIQIGKNLIFVKEMLKKTGFPWEPWSETNLGFIGKRNRQRMMHLAKRKDCHKYHFLGVDRLEILCSSTPDKGPDPIGTFMAKYNIVFDPTQEFDPDKFKKDVDAAINMERLSNEGVTADAEVVRNLTLGGVKFDKNLVDKLKYVKDSGGDVNTCLKNISVNKGQDTTEPDEEKRLRDFNSLSTRLIQTIDYIIKDDDQLEKVDAKTLTQLLRRLVTLQKATVPTEQVEAA